MTNQSQPSVPDPWAQAERIAAQWEEAGRGVDRPTQVARVRAARAARAAALSEARLKVAVDKAVREALARPEFAEAVDGLTGTAVTPPTAPVPPDRPLHELTAEEWRTHAQETWAQRLPQIRRPMTVSELIADRYEDDGEA